MPDDTHGKHILAIDQSQDVLDLFQTLLEDEGYRVTIQSFVQKDLKAVQAMAPDLIILDYMWEFEDTGWAFLQMVKMNPATQAIPIVLCTGAVNRVEELSGHLMKMDVRVVIKPFNLDDLLDAIAAALNTTASGTTAPEREQAGNQAPE
jgi:CheY-like chemotaxis protein